MTIERSTERNHIAHSIFMKKGSTSVRPTLYTHQPMNLHEQLRTARREKGMTQQEAADLLGMKRETYNRIERGTSSTTVATMQKAGNAFGLVLTFSKAEK